MECLNSRPGQAGKGGLGHEAEIDRHCRRGRDHQARRHSRHVADPIARRRGAERDGRCRAQTSDIDGIATAGETPTTIAHYLGLTPKWVDGTAVGGCSFMIHTRHAAAAIASGLCDTVLITHGESGRSGVGRTRNVVAPTSLAGQFEQPYGPMGPPTLFTIPVLRYMKTYGLTDETLAMVSVVQREWAGKNPRATFKDPITVDDVLEFADDRLPVPVVAVLPGDRWRRRVNSHRGRARQGFSEQAGLHPRHRRERRDPDGQPDEGFHLVERVPRVGRQGLCRGRHHP